MKRTFFFRARELLRDPSRMLGVVTQAWSKAYAKRSVLLKVWDDFLTLFRLLRAWAMNEYRDISKKSVLWAVAAVLYFLSPLDVFPDILPGGYLDDIAVISYVLSKIRVDLDKFLAWEKLKKA